MRKLTVLTLIAALVVSVGHAPGTASASADAAAVSVAKKPGKKKAKRKTVRCRKGKVPIKVGRRTVGCRSLRAALPAPRAADSRLLLARAALDDLGALRDRRGRRASSLRKLARKVGPRGYRTLQRAIPQGLRRMDRLAATAAGASAAQRLPTCAGAPAARTDTYSSRSGGLEMTATLTAGALGTFGLRLKGGGHTISVRIISDECSHFDGPVCPTAAGVVDATDSSTYRVSLTVAKGDTVLMSNDVSYRGQTKMRAQVAPDANLDWIDIDDTLTATIDVGGTQQEFGPVKLRYTVIHRVRVDMPDGDYEPGHGAVDISLTARGVKAGRSELGDLATDTAKELDSKFAALVADEIANFKRRQEGWKRPATGCVEIALDPPSRRLKLSRGQRGKLSAHGVAKEGGGAVHGPWTVPQQDNASFAPAQVDGAEPSFSYEVTKAGKDVLVSATVQVTSRAGVGAARWEQEAENAPLYRGTVAGTAGESHPGECGGTWQWSYSARLADSGGSDQPFAILAPGGDAYEGGGAAGYDETGSGTSTLAPCHGLPGCSTGLGLGPGNMNSFVLFDAVGETVWADVAVNFMATAEACGGWAVTLGMGSVPRSTIGAETITVDLSFGELAGGTLTLIRVN